MRHLAGKVLLDKGGQYSLHQRRTQAAQRSCGDQQGAALGIKTQGTTRREQQQGQPQQGGGTGKAAQARGEQHADPDEPERQQGEPGEGVHPQRQGAANLAAQRADGGKKGAQVKASQDNQHQQGKLLAAPLCRAFACPLTHDQALLVWLVVTGSRRDLPPSG